MKIAVLVITVLLLSGCGGSKIDGTYCNKSSDLVVACYTFRSNGTVLYSAAGMEFEMKYEVEGDKIKVMDRQGNGSLVLTVLEDGSIQGNPVGLMKLRSGTGMSQTPARSGNASAEQVAKEMRGKVACPAKITTPVAAGAPVIDIVGIRPGLTYEEAANVVLCDNPMLVVEAQTASWSESNTYGQKIRQGFNARFAKARITKTSKQIKQGLQDNSLAPGSNRVTEDMNPGEVQYTVATMGVPGQERVISGARAERFGEGKNPTVDSVTQALTGKYGPATATARNGSSHWLRYQWVYDPAGLKVVETSPLYRKCSGVARPNDLANLRTECGVVVAAFIVWMPDNPGLASRLQVAVVDFPKGYLAFKSTEEELRKDDNARKLKELQEANKNAAKPKL